MVQELWRMEYFFPMSSGINLPWILLTLEHHREGSNNCFSSRNFFWNIKSCIEKLILLKIEDYSWYSWNASDLKPM